MLLIKSLKIIAIVTLINSCATSSDESVKGNRSSNSENRSSNSRNQSDNSNVNLSTKDFVVSLSNNNMTSLTVDGAKAEKALDRASNIKEGSDIKMKAQLAEKIAAQRLSRKGMGAVLGTAKKLADIEMKKGVQNEISPKVKLEIGIAAIYSQNYAMAEFMLDPLSTSKNRTVAAGALNALGVMTLKEGRVPEAMQLFKKSLSMVSDYEAAMLNMAFTALKYGDLDTARKMLGRLKIDWFSDYGKLVFSRQTGNDGEVKRLCEKLLKENHKPSVFSCGLQAWYQEKNPKKARELINKALQMRGGPNAWEQKGYKILEQIPMK